MTHHTHSDSRLYTDVTRVTSHVTRVMSHVTRVSIYTRITTLVYIQMWFVVTLVTWLITRVTWLIYVQNAHVHCALIRTCDFDSSHVWHDSFTPITWSIYMVPTRPVCSECVTWLITRGPWLITRGTWLITRGPWLITRGPWLITRVTWLSLFQSAHAHYPFGFICVTWLVTRVTWRVHTRDMTHLYIQSAHAHCSFGLCDRMCAPFVRMVHHSYVRHDSSHVWHDPFTRVTWLIQSAHAPLISLVRFHYKPSPYNFNMTHSHVRYDSFTCVT